MFAKELLDDTRDVRKYFKCERKANVKFHILLVGKYDLFIMEIGF